jgi:hypothetical protein
MQETLNLTLKFHTSLVWLEIGIGIKFSFGFHAFEKVDDFGIIAEDLIFFSFCPLVFFLLLIAVTSGQVDFFAQHETWCKPMTSGLFCTT